MNVEMDSEIVDAYYGSSDNKALLIAVIDLFTTKRHCFHASRAINLQNGW